MIKNFSAAKPQSENQRKYIDSIRQNIITICTGYAGTGKTYLALSEAAKFVLEQPEVYERIIIIRPYIASNTGEKLGALPGELNEKVAPYAEAIKDNLRSLMKPAEIEFFLKKKIEFSVLSMCRGRSFSNCIVIIEEAQNVPIAGNSMKMLLSRIGNNAKMIICGDTDQIDISGKSALEPIIKLLKGIKKIGFIELNEYTDIQRSPIIRSILQRFEEQPRWHEEA